MKRVTLLLVFLVLSSITFAQLSGNYYIPQGANPQGFATLAAAIDSLNEVGLSGTVYFYIDDNLAETGSLLKFYRGDLSSTNKLIIKPAATKTPTITITGCITTGHQSYAGITLDSTSYITFDGSNTVGGTTRDLTISMNDATNGRTGIQLYGNADVIVIKNLIIKYGQAPAGASTSRGVYVNGQSTGATNGITVENCKIGDGTFDPAYCVSVTGGSSASIYVTEAIIRNNELYGTLRRVYFYFVGTTGTTSEISGNEIYGLNAPPAGFPVWGIIFNTYNGTINIINNTVHSLRSVATATEGMYGLGTLTGQTGVILNIYNNFFGGDFVHSGTGIPASVDVVSFQDAPANATVKLYHNTVVLNNMTKKASGRMTCLRFNPVAGSTFDIKNNIFINQRDSSVAKALYFAGSTTLFTSDNNDIYVTGVNSRVGYYNATELLTLNDWQDSTGADLNSLSIDPLLNSLTDFHLSSTSTPVLGKGILLPGFTTDIDGETRDTIPEIGADEFPGIIPVELISFSANMNGNSVVLNWQTATELNSSYFDIQRSNDATQWNSIGQVSAAGNSTNALSYSFVDNNISGTNTYYRLKQVDFDGSFTYTKVVEVNLEIPSTFSLSQNYPNPFNPTTKISYSIPVDSKVTISVYAVTGELVAELINDNVAAGSHYVDFNGSNLASGMYIYKMVAGNFTQSNKMMLVK